MNNEQEMYKNLPKGSLMILQCVVGSTVHGTSVAGTDDRDEMGICVEPIERVVGHHHFETMVWRTQPEGMKSGPGDIDLVVHSLRKWTRLATKGNPTILLPLFVPDAAFVGKPHPFGLMLRKHSYLFVSKDAGLSFLGYLVSQKQRLKGERGQMRVTRTDLIEQYGFDTKYAGHVIRLAHQGIELMTTGRLTLPMPIAARQEVLDVRTGKFTLEQVLERTEELEKKLVDSLTAKDVPEHADVEMIDRITKNIYLDTWRPTDRPTGVSG